MNLQLGQGLVGSICLCSMWHSWGDFSKARGSIFIMADSHNWQVGPRYWLRAQLKLSTRGFESSHYGPFRGLFELPYNLGLGSKRIRSIRSSGQYKRHPPQMSVLVELREWMDWLERKRVLTHITHNQTHWNTRKFLLGFLGRRRILSTVGLDSVRMWGLQQLQIFYQH